MDNKETQQKDVIELEMPPVKLGSSAKGMYKYEVHDKNGLVYDSGDWKPNLILDCGLDKLADMPWAQTFQWSVVGTDPTPTVDKYEDTQTRVSLFLDHAKMYENIDPDFDNIKCWQEKPPALIARAEAGCLEAPLEPQWLDPTTGNTEFNIPEVATGFRRTFGRKTETGKTLYLRDLDLQFKVLSAVPEYTVRPVDIQLQGYATYGSCSSLSKLDTNEDILEPSSPPGGADVITPAASIASTPFSNARGSGASSVGAGYLSGDSKSMRIGMGDPAIPLMTAAGAINPSSGISVTQPTGRAATMQFTYNGNDETTGFPIDPVGSGELTITDSGDGFGYNHPDCGTPFPPIIVQPPSRNAHHSIWNWNRMNWNDTANKKDGSYNTGNNFGLSRDMDRRVIDREMNSRFKMTPANFKRVFGTADVTPGTEDATVTLQDGSTAFSSTSGYNAGNIAVCMAQYMFLELFEHGEQRGYIHQVTGGGPGTNQTGVNYTWTTGNIAGGKFNPNVNVRLNNQYAPVRYNGTGFNSNIASMNSGRSYQFKDICEGIDTETGVAMAYNLYDKQTQFNLDASHPEYANLIQPIYRNRIHNHTYSRFQSNFTISIPDPETGIAVAGHGPPQGYNHPYQKGRAIFESNHGFAPEMASGTLLTMAGTEANSADKQFENNSHNASDFVAAMKSTGMSQIDVEAALHGMESSATGTFDPDVAVVFQLPVSGFGSSLKEWRSGDVGYSSQSKCIIDNSQLLKGVASIGQGRPDTIYSVPLINNRNNQPYDQNNHWFTSSYQLNATDLAAAKAQIQSEFASNADNCYNTQGNTAHGGLKYHEDPNKPTWCPGAKSMTNQVSYNPAVPAANAMEVHTNSVGAIHQIVIRPYRMLEKLNPNAVYNGTAGEPVVASQVQRWFSNASITTGTWGNTPSSQDSRKIVRLNNLPYQYAANDDFLGLGSASAPVMEPVIENCKVVNLKVTDPGRGYRIGESPTIVMGGPTLKKAEIIVSTDNSTGSVSAVEVVEPGSGYSCTEPATFTFPGPPPQRVKRWNLQVKPVNSYENINNNYYFKRGNDDDPTGVGGVPLGVLSLGDGQDNPTSAISHACDVYHTEQTYLGSGKTHFDQGTHTRADQGGYEHAPDRYGPCHYVDHGTVVNGQTVTHNQYKTHGWYMTGVNAELNSQYCGTSFLSAANQMSLVRTFDYYMELQPVTYTEIGFKESPAARELFSRIVFDDPIRLRAGQYLRIAYQLLVTMEPGPTARYKEVPTEGTWYNGERVWTNENIDQTNPTNTDGVDYAETTTKVLSGYEAIQGNGMCIVDQRGIAVPYDITGVANEPFAPGTFLMGPQYGYVNRWKNGDTRLSFPTREYNNDINNPWVLGGDQMAPPDWAIKFFDSPTQNYRPRDFRSFVEWPAYRVDIPRWNNYSSAMDFENKQIGAGPELTFERDAFQHWFTPYFPNLHGSIQWSNFAPMLLGSGAANEGRWDFTHTKPYVREVYPDLMREPNVSGITVSDAWYEKYRKGELIAEHSVGQSRSGAGVWMAPVIPYDGDPGGMVDPTTISTARKNRMSVLGGMGVINRATYVVKNPYTNKIFKMLGPNNIPGSRSSGYTTRLLQGCGTSPSNYTMPGYQYDSQGNRWCKNSVEPINRDEAMGPMGLINRRSDATLANLHTTTYLSDTYGGGFTTLDSWKPWTHTPRISSLINSTPDSYGYDIRPDTAGNWSGAESIPTAGTSAFISTDARDFVTCGEWVNRSHTVYGAVSGGGKPVHDYDRSITRGLGLNGVSRNGAGSLDDPRRSPSYRVDSYQPLLERDLVGIRAGRIDEGSLSFEAPTYLNDYTRGDHKREKYAEWETSFANLTGVRCVGLGPTSTTLNPTDMTDAARFNTYVFKFGDGANETATTFPNISQNPTLAWHPSEHILDIETGKPGSTQFPPGDMSQMGANAFNKLTTYKLKATFQFTWYRDLS
ncbi:hypothetical protein OAU81_00250 [bacterium]|nr:hypothetical protein [bacterium]